MKRMESSGMAASGGSAGASGSGGGRRMSAESGGSGQITLERLREMGKKNASARVHRELAVTGQSESLGLLLDYYLSPGRTITDAESIDWCKWLIAGGRTPGEFASIGEFEGLKKDFMLVERAQTELGILIFID
ncbi:conserved hypothetical protein [Culex quinquefasciatus]|uniref:Uncharacterized protein n=1 Tax=Culex quinquefasciatus TaxID=7176 RepID=B0WQY3_CULQU|nr:conserved hypothetical protein [Culex quinquefasciatus]|eukprot:XP_001851117.1 conserved hypothetical protein [Culex quinquefasciatus]